MADTKAKHKARVVRHRNGWAVVCPDCGPLTDTWAYRFLAACAQKDHEVTE